MKMYISSIPLVNIYIVYFNVISLLLQNDSQLRFVARQARRNEFSNVNPFKSKRWELKQNASAK